MIPLKLRRKLLNKLAQAVPGAPASPTAPTSPTAPNAPTTPASTTSATIPPPPDFQASSAWGWMGEKYNAASVGFINSLVTLLNKALHYASQGKFNWQILRNNFDVDASAAGGTDAKNILNLSKLVHDTYLNKGNAFPQKVTGTQIAAWNTAISQSQSFLNLSQLNPTGTIAQKMGNPKDAILNILRDLARYNPVQPQQPR